MTSVPREMTSAEKTARAKVAARRTCDLVNDFILTGRIADPNIPMVRGWIMDELEKRNPAAFESWLDDERNMDESLRDYFH